MWILAQLLTEITGKPRYIPKYTSSNLWVCNLFRVCEQIFGREVGVRAEASAEAYQNEDGEWITIYRFFTLEALLAHAESVIRAFLAQRIPKFRLVEVPAFATSRGVMFPPIFSLAIAFDNAASDVNATETVSPYTPSYTVTGASPNLYVGVTEDSSGNVSAVSYNSVALSVLDRQSYAGGALFIDGWYLGNPATGAHTLSFTFTVRIIRPCWASYSGCGTTHDGHTGGSVTGTTLNLTLTTTVNNDWLVAYAYSGDTAPSAGTGTTSRVTGESGFSMLGDSNLALTPAGSFSLQFTHANGNLAGPIVAIQPSGGAVVTTRPFFLTLLGVT